MLRIARILREGMLLQNAHLPTFGTGQVVLMSYKCAPGRARHKLATTGDSSTAAGIVKILSFKPLSVFRWSCREHKKRYLDLRHLSNNVFGRDYFAAAALLAFLANLLFRLAALFL
jgi:hypothetical protein